jgi:hypothetical protein
MLYNSHIINELLLIVLFGVKMLSMKRGVGSSVFWPQIFLELS